MGLIAQRIAARYETRDDKAWLTREDGMEMGRPTPSGVRVNRQTALGLTTIWRCIDLLSSSVSQAPKDVVLKVGGRSFPEFTKPSWLVTPNPLDPTYTANDYFAQVAVSLLMDGNFFVSVFPNVLDPVVLTVLDPGRVNVKPGPIYEIKNATGTVTRTLGAMEMLHGTWLRAAGTLRGISPLEALRRAMGNAIAAEEHAGRFFGQGATLSFGVEVPGKMTNERREELSASFAAKYAGLANSHNIGVLTDGAKFVGNLAPTPEQAQMLATRKFGVEDLCRPYGVPPNMAGSQEPGASSYASADIWRDEFRDYAVLPLAVRIEVQHNRLVHVPEGIADPNASGQFKFNLDHVARTSLLMRYQAYAAGVLGGFKTPAQIRVLEDDPPVDPNATDPAEKLYMQQQMVPLADLGSTKATEPLDTQPAPAGTERSEPPTVNVNFGADAFRGMAPMTVEGSTTNVAAPSMQPIATWMERAVQTITDRPIHVAAPEVTVNVPPPTPVRKRFERDEKGQITAMIEE